jgi:hypothetical protein
MQFDNVWLIDVLRRIVLIQSVMMAEAVQRSFECLEDLP